MGRLFTIFCILAVENFFSYALLSGKKIFLFFFCFFLRRRAKREVMYYLLYIFLNNSKKKILLMKVKTRISSKGYEVLIAQRKIYN